MLLVRSVHLNGMQLKNLRAQLKRMSRYKGAAMKHQFTLNAVLHRARLYSALLGHTVAWSATTLHRRWNKDKHPLDWSLQQDWTIGFMRTLFQVGTYYHWRNAINLLMHTADGCNKQLDFTCVPPDTFKQQGFRDSWMISLKPELHPTESKASFVLMYFHGGAFVAGDPLMYRPAYLHWMKQLAARGIHMRVFAVGYPLAPENTFPAALHGAAEAYKWLVNELGGSDKIVIAGDSAGGNLTVAVLTYLRDHSSEQSDNSNNTPATDADAAAKQHNHAVQLPRAAILISPALDFSSSSVFTKKPFGGSDDSSTLENNFHWDYISAHENVDVMDLYISSHSPKELSDPLISPVYLEDFSGLVQQEFLVVAGGCEAMTPDIRRFVDRVKNRSPDVPIMYHEEKNEPHCYCMLSGMDHLIKKGATVVIPFLERMVLT